MSHKDKWCMYVWIVQGPEQKKMRKGKACGQTGHAFARLGHMMSNEEWDEYLNYEVKIVYKVSTPEELKNLDRLIFLRAKYSTLIYDETWGMYTAFGLLTKEDPNTDGRWKLA